VTSTSSIIQAQLETFKKETVMRGEELSYYRHLGALCNENEEEKFFFQVEFDVHENDAQFIHLNESPRNSKSELESLKE
jgi:hypothetical protein